MGYDVGPDGSVKLKYKVCYVSGSCYVLPKKKISQIRRIINEKSSKVNIKPLNMSLNGNFLLGQESLHSPLRTSCSPWWTTTWWIRTRSGPLSTSGKMITYYVLRISGHVSI